MIKNKIMELTIALINKDLRETLDLYNYYKREGPIWGIAFPEVEWDFYLKRLELKINQHKKAIKILKG